jgi:rare lipoprotein A
MTKTPILAIGFTIFSLSSIQAGEIGIASKFCELTKTASGRSFSCGALVAAHRTLPFGKRVTVKNLANGRQVIVTIVDRGPFIKGRIIDLSEGAARLLGSADLMRVELSTN